MSRSEEAPKIRARREPPRFRPVEVRAVERLSPRMARVAFAGEELAGLAVEQPAASVRLLLPSPGSDDLVMPAWNGNEFLLPDGRRPTIRTFTPPLTTAEAGELDLHFVVHGDGAASQWAAAARPGLPAAISGPGRGYVVDVDAPAFLLAGDETAIPAITQLMDAIPDGTPVQVFVEVGHPDGRLDLANVDWRELPPDAPPGAALVEAVRNADIAPDTKVWAAGEAAAVQAIRRHLFEERGLARTQASVRGYWKHGRTGDAGDDD